jgi:hypothetical protein
MAVGDIKGTSAVVIDLLAGATIVKGDVVHLVLADGDYVPAVDTDIGKFAVAIEAAADTAKFKAVIFGPVEVKATNAAIANGALVMAGTTAKVAKADATGCANGEVLGTAMAAFGANDLQTIWLGLTA